MKNRVVITGLGAIAPTGIGKEAFWHSLMKGASGARRISFPDCDMKQFASQIACPVDNFLLTDYIQGSKDLRFLGRTSQFAMAATKLALEDAGIEVEMRTNGKKEQNYRLKNIDPYEVGIILGIGSEISDISEKSFKKLFTHKGPKRNFPYELPQTQLSCVTGNISRKFGINGNTVTVATACASGLDAIIEAYKHIHYGEERLVITGGAEASITPSVFGGFVAVNALSKRNDEPEKASRPFDKGRDGFVMGEGAGIVIVEELTHAVERGAPIYCEIVGFGKTNDGYHMTAPNPSAVPQSEAMKRALKKANIAPTDIDYINAHGTSTVAGDVMETKAIKQTLGNHAGNVHISATKSMIGHLLAAGGSIEIIATAMIIKEGKMHPTINLEKQDWENGCDLQYVPHHPLKRTITFALKNSFGFGGYNSVVALKRFA